MRIFAGTFLSNNANDNYYDFNVSRVNDYLFQYDLYGRSEAEGFFSQQYIKAEGALRTTGDLTSANQWLLTAQSATTIWRWVEGLCRNRLGQKTAIRTLKPIGARALPLTWFQTFLKCIFPSTIQNGAVFTNNAYPKNIRFQLSLRPASLSKLFSRSWF